MENEDGFTDSNEELALCTLINLENIARMVPAPGQGGEVKRERAIPFNVLEEPTKVYAKISNAQKTHCPAGHPLSGDNVRHYRGWRVCKKCKAIKNRVKDKLQRTYLKRLSLLERRIEVLEKIGQERP